MSQLAVKRVLVGTEPHKLVISECRIIDIAGSPVCVTAGHGRHRLILEYNENHDEQGQFASGGGEGGSGSEGGGGRGSSGKVVANKSKSKGPATREELHNEIFKINGKLERMPLPGDKKYDAAKRAKLLELRKQYEDKIGVLSRGNSAAQKGA